MVILRIIAGRMDGTGKALRLGEIKDANSAAL